jgi:hypothetical protein
MEGVVAASPILSMVRRGIMTAPKMLDHDVQSPLAPPTDNDDDRGLELPVSTPGSRDGVTCRTSTTGLSAQKLSDDQRSNGFSRQIAWATVSLQFRVAVREVRHSGH